MSSEQVATDAVAEPRPRRRRRPPTGRGLSQRWFLLIGGVIILDIVALIVVPPFPKDRRAGRRRAPSRPASSRARLEFPAPHIVLDLDPANRAAGAGAARRRSTRASATRS